MKRTRTMGHQWIRQAYETDGYVLIDELFSGRECEALLTAAHKVMELDVENRILESDSNAVRSLYDLHKDNELFRDLVADRRVHDLACDLLGSRVYIHQTQLNPKAAFVGDSWEWHQDFLFWQRDDGMPAPRAVNVVLYLTDMTMFNGPMFVVPGSHREDLSATTETIAHGWERTLTNNLRHAISETALRSCIERNGMASPLGGAGSVLLFDPRIVHGSPSNISPFERTALFIRYNSVENALVKVESPRPSWLAERNPAAIEPLSRPFLVDGPPD